MPTTPCRHGPVLVASALLGALLCSGCGYVTVLRAEEERPLASGRALWRFGEAAGIEAQVARARATSRQELSDLDTATVDGRSISGPVSIRNTATHRHAHLAYNHRIRFGSRFDIEWMAGVAVARGEWVIDSDRANDPQLASRASWSGPMGGIAGRFNFNDRLALEGRFSGAYALSRGVEVASYGLSEIVLAWRPAPGLAIRGGYAQYGSGGIVHPGDSEQAMRARGPYLGLGVEF